WVGSLTVEMERAIGVEADGSPIRPGRWSTGKRTAMGEAQGEKTAVSLFASLLFGGFGSLVWTVDVDYGGSDGVMGCGVGRGFRGIVGDQLRAFAIAAGAGFGPPAGARRRVLLLVWFQVQDGDLEVGILRKGGDAQRRAGQGEKHPRDGDRFAVEEWTDAGAAAPPRPRIEPNRLQEVRRSDGHLPARLQGVAPPVADDAQAPDRGAAGVQVVRRSPGREHEPGPPVLHRLHHEPGMVVPTERRRQLVLVLALAGAVVEVMVEETTRLSAGVRSAGVLEPGDPGLQALRRTRSRRPGNQSPTQTTPEQERKEEEDDGAGERHGQDLHPWLHRPVTSRWKS
ncbi:hypothetical protein GW17_00058652, partial [Ensete ventricosum]